jgi:hypothetical protein
VSDVNSVTNSGASSINEDEDTTVGPEALAARPEPRSRRRRKRLSQRVQRQIARSNFVRIALSILLGLGVVAASTYLARFSSNVDFSIARTK